jgi:hypothetical protein
MASLSCAFSRASLHKTVFFVFEFSFPVFVLSVRSCLEKRIVFEVKVETSMSSSACSYQSFSSLCSWKGSRFSRIVPEKSVLQGHHIRIADWSLARHGRARQGRAGQRRVAEATVVVAPRESTEVNEARAGQSSPWARIRHWQRAGGGAVAVWLV